MKNRTLLCLCFLVAASSIHAADAPISEAQAAQQARESQALARQLWTRGLAVCNSSAVTTRLAQGHAIAEQANQRARDTLWDTQTNKARIPYAACNAMLADAAVLARACTEQPEPEDAQHTDPARWQADQANRQKWVADNRECSAAIKHPDMSYKHLQ